jgi:hypothetical protein
MVDMIEFRRLATETPAVRAASQCVRTVAMAALSKASSSCRPTRIAIVLRGLF